MTYTSWPEVYPTVNQPEHEKHLDWTYECGVEGCTWVTYHRSQEGARAERERHHEHDLCPYTDARRIITEKGALELPVGPSIIEKYWLELDKVTKLLMDQRVRFKNDEMTTDELEGYMKLQGQAQGIAYCLQVISVPHFEDVPAVSRWALKRYRMSRGDIEHMDTPGVQGYNPMPEPTRELAKPAARKAAAKRGPKAAPETGKFRAFSDEDRTHLTGMVNQGLPDAVIQSILKISPEQFDKEKAKL